jgi:hypothetical protein
MMEIETDELATEESNAAIKENSQTGQSNRASRARNRGKTLMAATMSNARANIPASDGSSTMGGLR